MKDVLNLKIEKIKITNMFGNHKFECEYGVGDDFIVIEMAKVCGLELIKENEIKNPLYTTTKGIGLNLQVEF
jgi:glycerate kinase